MKEASLSNSQFFAQALLAAITLTYGSAFLGLWLQYRRKAMRAFAAAWIGLGFYSAFSNLRVWLRTGTGVEAAGVDLAFSLFIAVVGVSTAMALVNAAYSVVEPSRKRGPLVAVGTALALLQMVFVAAGLDDASLLRIIVVASLGWAVYAAWRAAPSPGRRSMIAAMALLLMRPVFGLLAVNWQPGTQPPWYTAIQLVVSIGAGFLVTVSVFSIERDAAVHERVELERGLALSQRMDSMGRMASGVAHDFNNILGTVQAASDFGSIDDATADDRRSAESDIAAAVQRGTELTRTLLSFARPSATSVQYFSPATRLKALVPIIERLAGHQITVTCAIGDLTKPAADVVRADPVRFDQLLLNLTANARDAMPTGGTLTIRCEDTVSPRVPGGTRVLAGRHVRLVVSDTGVGMTADTIQRIFEPFFTTKGEGKGTGLGLSTAFSFVQQAEGYIGAESVVDGGSTFTVLLPVAEAAAAAG